MPMRTRLPLIAITVIVMSSPMVSVSVSRRVRMSMIPCLAPMRRLPVAA
jgi:hypothetical protein